MREPPYLSCEATLALSLGLFRKCGLADIREALPKRSTVEVIEV
jgi:hypothetical protein